MKCRHCNKEAEMVKDKDDFGQKITMIICKNCIGGKMSVYKYEFKPCKEK